jgi:hypothetical protein
LATAPPGTPACPLLVEAERLLLRDAANEAEGRSWRYHTGNVVVNAAIFFLIGAGFGQWLGAAISGVIGIAVGETMILTQPDGAVAALRRYRAGELGPAAPARLGLAPLAGPRANGVTLGFSF